MYARGVVAAFALAVAGAALTGCAPAQPDPSEVQAWLQEQPSAASDVIAEFSGSNAPGSEELDPANDAGGTTMEFEVPVTVERIEFACFGEATVSVEIEITRPSSVRGVGAEAVPCSDGMDFVDGAAGKNVSAVRVKVTDANVLTAWRATVHGSGD